MTEHRFTDLHTAIVEGIHSKKGSGVKIIDLSRIETAPTHTFVVCQARNPIQVAAVADAITDGVLENVGRKPSSTDGYRNREWIIIDYGDTIVHIFLPETRLRYAIEELYSDAPITSIDDEDDTITNISEN